MVKAIAWKITYFGEKEGKIRTWEEILAGCKKEWIQYLILQKESGARFGGMHWQGYVEISKRGGCRPSELMKILGMSDIEEWKGEKYHESTKKYGGWAMAVGGKNAQKNLIDYCKKTETRVEKFREFGLPRVCRSAKMEDGSDGSDGWDGWENDIASSAGTTEAFGEQVEKSDDCDYIQRDFYVDLVFLNGSVERFYFNPHVLFDSKIHGPWKLTGNDLTLCVKTTVQSTRKDALERIISSIQKYREMKEGTHYYFNTGKDIHGDLIFWGKKGAREAWERWKIEMKRCMEDEEEYPWYCNFNHRFYGLDVEATRAFFNGPSPAHREAELRKKALEIAEANERRRAKMEDEGTEGTDSDSEGGS